ncbi:MAG: hypothetical protein KC592_12745, partial [Nitrospira sp.]|nr:hypothetical protein [Nitrospira sp.]
MEIVGSIALGIVMRIRNKFAAALLGLICILAAGTPSLAAVVQRVNNEKCGIALTGQIEKGDLDKLTALAVYYSVTSAVCLDSPGGSFSEAIEISKYLYENGFGTYVGNDARCLSACAIVFMFGNFSTEVGPTANRTIHVNGKVGFHRPTVAAIQSAKYGSEDVEHAFDLALESIWRFFQLANQPMRGRRSQATAFPADLFENMISRKGPTGFFYLDQIQSALQWDIEVDGLRRLDRFGSEALYNVCNNYIRQQQGTKKDPLSYQEMLRLLGRTPVILVNASTDGKANNFYYKVRSDFIQEEIYPLDCSFPGDSEALRRIPESICLDMAAELEFRVGKDPTCAQDELRMDSIDPRLMIFSPRTRIDEANTVSLRLETSGGPIATADPLRPESTQSAKNTLHSQCVPQNPNLFVVNVNEFANVRASPSFGGAIVA